MYISNQTTKLSVAIQSMILRGFIVSVLDRHQNEGLGTSILCDGRHQKESLGDFNVSVSRHQKEPQCSVLVDIKTKVLGTSIFLCW